MKKKILISAILSMGLFVQGQTLKETQDWLKQKIESYGTWSKKKFEYLGAVASTIHTIQNFDFINNEVIIKTDEVDIVTDGVNSTIEKSKNIRRFSFNKIASLEIKEDGVIIKTKGNQITHQKQYTSKQATSEKYKQLLSELLSGHQDDTTKTNSYFIGIDFSKEDNLSERFKKAINRLLTFIPKQQKEAF